MRDAGADQDARSGLALLGPPQRLGGTGRAQSRAPGLSDWRSAGGGEPWPHCRCGDTDTGDRRHRASPREAEGRARVRAARSRLLKGPSGLTTKEMYAHIDVRI